MDLSELIKCYNMEHKSLFTAFAVSFPVLFTVLYLYIPEFANLEFYEQVVFSATASIFCVLYRTFLPLLYIEREGNGTEEDIYLCLSAPLPLPFG